MDQIRQVGLSSWKCGGGLLANCNYDMGGGESFADDLNGNRVL